MTLEGLAALVQAHRHLARGVPAFHAAVLAVPELVDGLPALTGDARGVHASSACADALKGPIDVVVSEAAAQRGPPPAVADLERRLANDPLVVAVATLAQEGAALSPAAATMPFLQALTSSAARARSEGRDPEKLARIAQAVVGRLGAACARLGGAGVRVPALAAAAATARAAAVWSRGAATTDPSPADVCVVLGSSVPPALADAALASVARAVSAALARRAAAKATPDDGSLLLRFVPPSLEEAGPAAAGAAVSRDPDAVAAILPDLARWVDASDLAAAHVDGKLAKRLLEPATGLAVAAALAEALRELRRWDVFTLLGSALTPPGDGRRGLVVPRGGTGKATVVAVGLGRLRAEAIRKSVDPVALAAVDRAWADVTRGAKAVAADLGHAGLLVFEDPVDAFRFALSASARLGPVPVGVGHGTLLGGTDGAVVRVSGPAVDGALRWMAAQPASARPGGVGGLGVQQLAHAGGWLCGNGIGIETAAEEALQEARMRRGLATALDGPPAGDPRVPRSLDMHRAFELDGEVIAVVRIAGVAGGFEALHLPVHDWRALLDRDGEFSEQPTPAHAHRAPEPVPSPSPEPAVAGEADGWEASEPEDSGEAAPVMLDLEEQSGPNVLPDPSDAFSVHDEFDETQEEHGRPLESAEPVTGFYLPGVDATPSAPIVLSAPRAAPPPSFDMEVVDDEDEGGDAPFEDPFALPVDGLPVEVVRPRGAATVVSADDDGDPFAGDPAWSEGADEPVVGEGFFVPPPQTSEPDPVVPVGPTKAKAPAPHDPFVDHQDRPEGDPFARAAKAAAAPTAGDDPFAVHAESEASDGDPFSESRRPAAARRDDHPPFGDAHTQAPEDPFAGFDPGGMLGLGGDQADPFAEPDPFTQEEPRDAGRGPSFAQAFGGPAAAEPAPAAAAKKPAAKGAAGSPHIDFEYLLRGYAWFAEGGQAVFGRPYGARLVDRHAYPYSGDPDEVYLTFLRDKIGEGFVPRTELMGDVPTGASLQPLENERLARAWSRLS
jgi:hypothetical protein